MNLGEALALKRERVIDNWVSRVCNSKAVKATDHLTYKGVLDSLPAFIDTVIQLLSEPTGKDIEDILCEGMHHGLVRAGQGYDAEEIVREYSVLRNVIFEVLEADLLKRDSLLLLRAMRLVDGAIDRVIAYSLKCYTEERLRDVNLLYDELLASNQELDWLVRSEQTNLAHLAHELKTPLSSIIGFSDLFLRQQAQNGEIHAHYIERVRTSGRRLLGMVNDALTMSSYKAGKVQLTIEPVQACQVVKDVATVLTTLAQQKGLAVSVVCGEADDCQAIETDKGRLRQIVTNLLSNAIRYTDEGNIHIELTWIKANDKQPERGNTTRSIENAFAQRRRRQEISLQETHERVDSEGLLGIEPFVQELADKEIGGDRIQIAVSDTGLGIDLAEQSQIFQPYYQGKAGQALACSTGLGLAITYQMVQLLGGNIALKSEPGVGSIFTITLPVQYQAVQPQSAQPQTKESPTPFSDREPRR